MNPTEMTFGVEIETLAPQTAIDQHGLQIGSYKHGVQVPYLPAGWKAEKDGSITGQGHACEIVSPVLQGAEGLALVAEVLAVLVAKGHTVNMSCGIHIHIGWKYQPAMALARLVTITSYCEKGLYAITGTKRREAGRYAKAIRKYGKFEEAKRTMDSDRYHLLNLQNLGNYGGKQTVEFRVFSGSLKAVKVLGWIQVCMGICQKATTAKKSPSWVPGEIKAGSLKRDGEGATECERLMNYLAWWKVEGGFGWINNPAVTRKAVMVEFRRLAAQYDAMPQEA